jgi:hypothetical protein
MMACCSIVDCCLRLIASSNSNRSTVAAASIITPINTAAVGNVNKWPPRAASQIIPPPTAIPPITAARINTKWGIDGSISPEKNWPIYVEMVATFILFLLGVAFADHSASVITLSPHHLIRSKRAVKPIHRRFDGLFNSRECSDKLCGGAGGSRHKSVETLRGYVRDAELFRNHAGSGLL